VSSLRVLKTLTGVIIMTKNLREYLMRRDPQGYYVIPAKRNALKYIENIKADYVDEVGDTIFIKVKSRRIAAQIIRILAKKKALAE